MLFKKEITFDRFVRGLLAVASFVLFVLAVDYLSPVLLPFVVAWFLAYLLYPVVSFFQYRLHLRSRVVSIVVTLLLIGGLVWAFCALTYPSIVREADHFKAIAVEVIEKGTNNKSISPAVEEFINEQAKNFEWQKLFEQQEFINLVKATATKAWSLLAGTLGVIITIVSSFIALLYFFFILYDYEKFCRGIKMLIPQQHGQFFKTMLTDLQQGMNNYFRGQALIALCVGILFSIGFLIIDFPLAIPLGIFIGELSFVPYLHAFGLVPAVLLSLLKAAETGQNFWVVLITCLAVFLIVQAIQDLVLTPKIMGDAVGLPPFLILLSLSVWGYVLGIIGMIVALPVTTLLISYYRRYIVGEIKT